jgi:hypothetical protein
MNQQNNSVNPQKIMKRLVLKDSLLSELEQTVDQRIDRYMEIDHQGIIGNHHFASASSECINLYRDGYFISAVMVSQAVNEGIVKFVAERNDIKEKKEHSDLMKEFVQQKIMSSNCAQASKKIWGSFRNDVHHMNPKVAKIPFKKIAKNNLQHLAIIEKEIFGANYNDGKLVPHHPQYWDVGRDGTVPVYLRLL